MTVWVVLTDWAGGSNWQSSVHAVCLEEAVARRVAEARRVELSEQGLLAHVYEPGSDWDNKVDALVTIEPCEVFG